MDTFVASMLHFVTITQSCNTRNSSESNGTYDVRRPCSGTVNLLKSFPGIQESLSRSYILGQFLSLMQRHCPPKAGIQSFSMSHKNQSIPSRPVT